jgi:hypothetical protein
MPNLILAWPREQQVGSSNGALDRIANRYDLAATNWAIQNLVEERVDISSHPEF